MIKPSFIGGCVIILILTSIGLQAQMLEISGKVTSESAEPLAYASISLLPDSIHVLTDTKGNFSITCHAGKKELIVSFVGYRQFVKHIHIESNTELLVELSDELHELKTITIEGNKDRSAALFHANQTSSHLVNKEDVTSIPVLGGEGDLIKTLQLLPGTVRGVEGSSDLFVRGGAADQNLVLLDGAPVYNTSHLFGFLSVFNPDILDEVEAINGGFPARYGGRLSSILNVKTVSEIPTTTHFSGDVGLIASRAMLEQPLLDNKASVWITGRRTYVDQVVKAIGEELPYFFYDINGKVTIKPDDANDFQFSYYSGQDVLDIFRDRNSDGNGITSNYLSANDSQSLRWKHHGNNNVISTLSFIRSRYRYDITNHFEENALIASSDLKDVGGSWFLRKDSVLHGSINAGVDWTLHQISPNVINTAGFITEIVKSSSTPGLTANEFSVYGEYNRNVLSNLSIATGFRVSIASVKRKSYGNPEPRVSIRYALSQTEALKFSYSRMAQYIHRVSNSAICMPTDIWYPVTSSIRPQTANQIAVAWQKKFFQRPLFLSVEGYYKMMNDLIGFREGANLFLNTDFERQLIQGKGKAYGLEFLFRKDAGKFSGWISYSLSWSWRRFDEVNEGRWFHARYDRRHNVAVVLQYHLTKRISFSSVWEYISGSRFTPVVGQYALLSPTLSGLDVLPIFSDINAIKLADAHRLDVGVKFRSKSGKKFQWHWFAGVYNVYNRATPLGIVIEQNPNDGSLKYSQPGLFGTLPFISYGFRL